MTYKLIVVGASSGGLHALETLLGGIPADLRVPIAVAQHRTRHASVLHEVLASHSDLPVREAKDKDVLKPGHVYLAPPNYHLLIEAGSLALSTDAPVHAARPSIDVLFDSAAATYRERVIAVLLTGASADGAKGMLQVQQKGGTTLVQDPATARSSVMPQAAIDSGGAGHILPLEQMPTFLYNLCAAKPNGRDEDTP